MKKKEEKQNENSKRNNDSRQVSFNSQTELQDTEMSSWSVDSVLYALHKDGLGVLGPIFREHHISGVSLGRLTHDTLKDIGLSSLGQRDKVLLMVEKYQKKDAQVAAMSVSGRSTQGRSSPAKSTPPQQHRRASTQHERPSV